MASFRPPNGLFRVLLVFFAAVAFGMGSGATEPIARPVGGPPALERFRQLKIEDGLSQSTIMSILQDHEGYFWFGTQDGLNRYDGYEFRIFRNDPTRPDSLGGSRVYSLFEDRSGTLWAGTGNGLSRYDRAHGTFVNFPVKPLAAGGTASARVISIVEDRAGTLWIATNEAGLASLDQTRKVFKSYIYDSANPRTLSGNRVTALVVDADGTLWVGTATGLCRYDSVKGDFERFFGNKAVPAELQTGNPVRALGTDRAGGLWVATSPGVIRFDTRNRTCERFVADEKSPHGLSDNFLQVIFEDRSGAIWLGTPKGLDKLDRATGRYIHYNRQTVPDAFAQDDIISIFEDSAGALWFGSQGNGTICLDRALHPFRRIEADPDKLDREVRGVYEDPSGLLWIGVSGGVRRYDPRTGATKLYLEKPDDPTSLSGRRVYAILEDRLGGFWIGTENGLSRFDRTTEKFTRYAYNRADPRSLTSGPVRVVMEDRAGDLWIGATSGICRYDRATDSFVRFDHDPKDPNSMNSGSLRTIFEDRDGLFWVGTAEGGLGRMDRATGKFQRFLMDPKNPRVPVSNYIYHVMEARDGTLWIGTGGGLHRYDRATGQFEVFTQKDGLPSATVYGILEDDAGNLWFSTNAGLVRFDPRAKRSRVYDRRDGLFNTEYTASSFFRSPSGEMYFGGTYGLDAFRPETIVDNPFMPPVVITGVRVFDRLVEEFDGKTLPPLRYDENILTFDFSALCFTVPEKNHYSYKLENFDADWRDSRGRRTATYTNLDPGEYVFRVRASNNDGVWNDTGASLRVTVRPPPWRTWWAYGLYVLGFVGLAFVGVQLQTARLAGRTRMREIRLRAETAEAEAAVRERDGEIFRLRNVELAEANRTITDSIAYARTIQQAMLPGADALRAAFGEIFVLYRPRDIVSGDFFWMHENEKGVKFVAVADCTGHGVPGAFMSVIGASLLNQIVIERNIESPAEILTELHLGVRRALRQDAAETAAQDGLDLAFCRIEADTITFAGAKRPLYAVDAEGRFIELSGDRASIGGVRRSAAREFRNYMLPREAGMTLYLATDGFADQNDGAGKPFGSKRLRELLRTNAKLPMAEQAAGLASALSAHQGDEPQRDDVTVLGLKLG